MPIEPITMWTLHKKRCVLTFAYGRFELVLQEHGRLIRLSIFTTEDAARQKAEEWADALDAVHRSPVVALWN
jgi:hypothetical protein